MSRFTIEVLAEAEAEFDEAFAWYFERNPLAADGFRAQVIGAIDGLAERADLWPANEDGVRYHVLDRFPYTLWYDLMGQTVTVLAVAHQHRRPGYWMGRRSASGD